MTLTFNTLRAMVMTYSHAKVQGSRILGLRNTLSVVKFLSHHGRPVMAAIAAVTMPVDVLA